MAPYSALAVANYFIDLATKQGHSLSPMKVQKLIYFAHGWHLAITEKPLISEQIQAWKYGPVIQSVYHEFKQFGVGRIEGKAMDFIGLKFDEPNIDSDDSDVRELLDEIYKNYGRLNAIQLSNLTHLPGTPWDKAWSEHDGMMSVAIDNEEIKSFFVSKAKSGAAAETK